MYFLMFLYSCILTELIVLVKMSVNIPSKIMSINNIPSKKMSINNISSKELSINISMYIYISQIIYK